jgi:phytoene dehydrogenase-like protein
MKKYDDIVVGSGISGMTMALILGMNGRRVLLLEKNPRIGGSVARFYKKGIPFDTGFHFTGGLQKDGILYDILSVLEIRDLIQPVFLSPDNAHSFFFESEDRRYEVPYGIENVKNRFKDYFPGEASAIERYFEKIRHVCDNTPSMNLRTLFSQQRLLDEDLISLDDVLNGLTQNPALKALLSGFAMCYGVRPNEISFANHSRMCHGLYQSVAGVRNGGSSFIKAFETKLKDYEVEILCNRHITGLADIHDKKAGRFILNTGEEISGDNCVFTIHPKEILKVLPERCLSRAFIDRVSSFESSSGFFSVFAVLNSENENPDFESSLFSIFPHYDINRLLDPSYAGSPALVLVKSSERTGGKTCRTVTAFETSFFEQVIAWKDSETGKRPQAYHDYKKSRTENILERILTVFPEYRNTLEVVGSASVLTFRDFLNNYDGSAYGIKQKVNQFNLKGKLPLRNLYAAGQSSLLPGIIGAMMSSLIVGRSIVDADRYNKFLLKNLR